jgi:acyl-ACP thioesterase
MSSSTGLPELQPLVPRPGDVRAFTHERRAGVGDVGPSGRMRLDSIARWVQDVAWADVEDAGLRELAVWLVRRTRIRVRRFPRIDADYALTTYVTGLGRMWAERRTDIMQVGESEPAVEVSCIWVHIDPERRMPTPVHQIEIDTWCGPSTRPVKARLGHPTAPPDAGERLWAFREAEMDIALHVNNAAYFTPFDEELLLSGPVFDDPAPIDLEIEYRTPAQAGEKRVLHSGPMRWIVGPAGSGPGEVHASAALAQWPV